MGVGEDMYLLQFWVLGGKQGKGNIMKNAFHPYICLDKSFFQGLMKHHFPTQRSTILDCGSMEMEF